MFSTINTSGGDCINSTQNITERKNVRPDKKSLKLEGDKPT